VPSTAHSRRSEDAVKRCQPRWSSSAVVATCRERSVENIRPVEPEDVDVSEHKQHCDPQCGKHELSSMRSADPDARATRRH